MQQSLRPRLRVPARGRRSSSIRGAPHSGLRFAASPEAISGRSLGAEKCQVIQVGLRFVASPQAGSEGSGGFVAFGPDSGLIFFALHWVLGRLLV